MGCSRDDFLKLLENVNHILETRGLPKYGFDYVSTGKGKYCLMTYRNFQRQSCTTYMSMKELYRFLQGLKAGLLMTGE